MAEAFLSGGIYQVGTAWYSHSLPLVEHIINDGIINNSNLQGNKVTCQKYCSACCHEQVLAQGLESYAAAAWINKQPRQFRKQLHKNLTEWHKQVERAGIILDLNNEEDIYSQAQKYWQARISCPFLVKNCCSIYPVRPFSCRTMLVTSPPEECSKSNGHIIRVQSKGFEQLVRNEILYISHYLVSIVSDKKLQKNLKKSGWFPHLTVNCLK